MGGIDGIVPTAGLGQADSPDGEDATGGENRGGAGGATTSASFGLVGQRRCASVSMGLAVGSAFGRSSSP